MLCCTPHAACAFFTHTRIVPAAAQVAIKRMAVTPKNLRHLLSEIDIQRQSSHPNIVNYLDGCGVAAALRRRCGGSVECSVGAA